MKLNQIRENMSEVEIGDYKVLFSYKTPVAVVNLTPEFHAVFGAGMIKTSKKWSKTTSRHINLWGAKEAKEVEQEYFDKLLAEVK